MKTDNETNYLGVRIVSGQHEDSPGEYWAMSAVDEKDNQYCFCSYYPSEAEAIEGVRGRLNEWLRTN